MEFIPLERYSKRIKNKKYEEKQKLRKSKKLEEETNEQVTVKKTKPKGRTKVFEKKNVKNKYKETLALKQKKRVPKKRNQKKKEEDEEIEEEEEEEEDENDEKEEENDEKEETMDLDDEGEEDSQIDDDEEEKDDEEAFKRKCQEMDDKKKNRLFVKLKKKILNKSQVLELHPDIKDAIFPRKKNSRWCWAVFTSEEKANKALIKLMKNKEVFVSKPTPHDKVDKRKKEKMKTVLRKKDASKKLQKMWM